MDNTHSKAIKRLDIILLGVILLLALSLRLYKLNTPLADIHSWRQVDTAAVARNFERSGINLLRPTYDDISSNQTGYENPEGLRMVEFPLYNGIIAATHTTFSFLSLEAWGRLITALFSLIVIGVLFYITLKEEGRAAAYASALTYAILPFFVFFSRVVLPETTALGFTMLSILFFYRYLHTTQNTFLKITLLIAASVSFALAVLVKPPAVFFALTVAFLFLPSIRHSIKTVGAAFIAGLIALIPFALWRIYITQYPEGIPAASWLITHVNTFEGMRLIFFRPAFFRWIFYERITNIVLGGYLTVFFILGLISPIRRMWFVGILAACTTYLFVFQGGNVQHEYYQTFILPAIALSVGRGYALLYTLRKSFIHPIFLTLIITITTIAGITFSYYRVSEFYRYPEDLVQIARVVQSLTDSNDLIVTDRKGDTTLLYLMDRKGAPSKYKPLDELKEMGYDYYITQNSEEIASLIEEGQYFVVFENRNKDPFGLFKL